MNEIIANFKTILTRKYTKFDGRANRKEFGFYVLVAFLISLVASVIDSFLTMGILSVLVFLALFLPGLALTFRRLHDLGFSAWLVLVYLVPCLNLCLLIYLLVAPGKPESNQYGPVPQ